MTHNIKIITFILIALLFTAGSGINNKETVVFAKDPQSLNLMIAATSAGPWLLYAEGIAGIIRKEIPNTNITIIPGTSDVNVAMLYRGEVDLAISSTDSTNNAIHGWEGFPEPIPINSVNTIACLGLSRFHFVVLGSLGINSIEEIKEKKIPLKISVGRRGSGVEMGTRRILEEYGITYEDIENWGGSILHFGYADQHRMILDGQLNSYTALSPVPMVELIELSMKREFKILPIRDDIIAKMVKEFNYIEDNIFAGSYKGQEEEIPTFCVASGLLVSGDMDEQSVYSITRALVNNIDILSQVHSQLKDITPEFMSQEMVFPLHPGAKHAYQE